MIIPLCRNCGQDLKVPRRSGPPRQFCNQKCRYRFWHPRKVKDRTRICLECGRKYEPRRRGKSQKYCSPSCAHKASRGRKVKQTFVSQTCLTCAKKFTRARRAWNKKWCVICTQNRRASAEIIRSAKRRGSLPLPTRADSGGRARQAAKSQYKVRKAATFREIQAYRFYYLQRRTLEQTGELLGCSSMAVSQALKRLRKLYPRCFPRKGQVAIMDGQLQKLWERKLRRALQADRQQGQVREAQRIAKFLPKKDRQRLAFDLVFAWGLPQEIAAREMGISQPGIAKLLKRFFLKHPQLRSIVRARPRGL